MKLDMRTGVAVAAAITTVALFFVFSNPLDFVESTPFGEQPAGELVVQDEVVGTGAEATIGSTVSVHYTGKLENGAVFDTSVGRAPYEFVLGAGSVIQGWEQGISGMKVGGKRLLIVPPDLAYGAVQYGPIPANSTLIFEVELVGVASAQ